MQTYWYDYGFWHISYIYIVFPPHLAIIRFLCFQSYISDANSPKYQDMIFVTTQMLNWLRVCSRLSVINMTKSDQCNYSEKTWENFIFNPALIYSLTRKTPNPFYYCNEQHWLLYGTHTSPHLHLQSRSWRICIPIILQFVVYLLAS